VFAFLEPLSVQCACSLLVALESITGDPSHRFYVLPPPPALKRGTYETVEVLIRSGTLGEFAASDTSQAEEIEAVNSDEWASYNIEVQQIFFFEHVVLIGISVLSIADIGECICELSPAMTAGELRHRLGSPRR
jgi:hypothetical protein